MRYPGCWSLRRPLRPLGNNRCHVILHNPARPVTVPAACSATITTSCRKTQQTSFAVTTTTIAAYAYHSATISIDYSFHLAGLCRQACRSGKSAIGSQRNSAQPSASLPRQPFFFFVDLSCFCRLALSLS